MVRVTCPACGPSHKATELISEVQQYRGVLKTLESRYPQNGALQRQGQLIDKILGHLTASYKQRLALQKVREGKTCLCGDRGWLEF